MPWTLYRYILKELLKLLVISTAVLLLVIGFAVTIKPMMDGMLGPVEMVKFLVFTIPTVLGFALPFSAAFASTMVFSRMASDREIQACRAAGMGYGTILFPVVFLGLALTLSMYFLSNWVVPSFYRSAENLVQKNLVQIILSQVQKHEPVLVPNTNMVIYADHAYEVKPEYNPQWKHQPDRLLVFEGMAVGRVDQHGLKNEITAEKAEVLLYHVNGQTWIQMRLTNVLAVDQGRLVQTASLPLAPVLVPSPLKDQARFLSWGQLRQIMREPDRFDEIETAKQWLMQSMARESLVRQIEVQLNEGASVTLKGVGAYETYKITSPLVTVQDQSVRLQSEQGQPVLVEQFDRGNLIGRFECVGAILAVNHRSESMSSEPEIELTMNGVTAMDAHNKERGSVQRELTRNDLSWPEPLVAKLGQYTALDLIAASGKHGKDSKTVEKYRDALIYAINQLWLKLISHVHQRAASAIACLLILLLGAVLSIKLHDRLPLVVYFWSFLLAFIAVVMINSGDNLVSSNSRHSLLMALTAIWAGNALLLGAFGLNYWKLSRT